MHKKNTVFTSVKNVIENTLVNFLGQIIPFVTAIVCIPLLLKGLGVDRFGVLNLVWVVVGYFGVLDFGLGRAITQMIASKIDSSSKEEISNLVWPTVIVVTILSGFGALVLVLFSDAIVNSLLVIPPYVRHETEVSFYVLSLSIPLVVAASVLRGILEGFNAFKVLNLIRIPLGIFTYASPLLVLPFSESLIGCVCLIFISRLINVIALYWISKKYLPIMSGVFTFNVSLISTIASQGGWITVSNLIGTCILYLDRFVVGSIVSASAIAYYSTSYEVITKLWLVPVSLTGVLFPLFSNLWVRNREKSADIFFSSIKFIGIFIFPIVLIILLFSKEILTYWLGSAFSTNSYMVLNVLCFGVFINCLAHVPFAYIQGSGRASALAKIHLLELVIYIPLVIYMTKTNSIVGTAIAWDIRAFFDFCALLVIFKLIHKETNGRHGLICYIVLMLGMFCLTLAPLNSASKLILLCAELLIWGLLTWHYVLAKEEKAVMMNLVNWKYFK